KEAAPCEGSGESLAGNDALGSLKGAHGWQASWRWLQRVTGEVASYAGDRGGHGVLMGGPRGRRAREDFVGRRAALHGDAGCKTDHVQPSCADPRVGPIEEPDGIGRQQEIVGADVEVEQGFARYGFRGARLEVGQGIKMAA